MRGFPGLIKDHASGPSPDASRYLWIDWPTGYGCDGGIAIAACAEGVGPRPLSLRRTIRVPDTTMRVVCAPPWAGRGAAIPPFLIHFEVGLRGRRGCLYPMAPADEALDRFGEMHPSGESSHRPSANLDET